MRLWILAFLIAAIPTQASGQDEDPAGPVRVSGQPRFQASDGSVSQIRRGEEGAVLGTLDLVPASGAFTLTFVIDDAMKCVGPHSVEHGISGDTLVVTLFDNAPALCPAASTPTHYTLSVTGFPPGRYRLLIFREGRGGRGGRASGAEPWFNTFLEAR